MLGGGFALPGHAALEVDDGVLDLGGTTSQLSTVTLVSGSIINGTLSASVAFNLQSGTVLANLAGPAALNKQGSGTVVLAGTNTYLGGTNALDGTLVAAMAGSLPSAATGRGTVIVAPTLYWSGSGDWTTGQWQLSDGTPTSWVDGSSVVLAAGSQLTLSGLVNVGSISVVGNATVTGGTLSLASGSIVVSSGTATIDSELEGGDLVKAGTGTLVLGGTLAITGMTIVDAGTLDLLSPLAAAPVVASGQAIGPGALFNANGASLYDLDPAMFALVENLFADQSIDRTEIIQILESAVVGGAVSDGALAALETVTLPQNEALLNMPDYVAVLAANVVQGNRANANYQGQPLGNLATQTTDPLRATALDDLVDKWFYGTDLPAISPLVSYSLVAGPLYGTNPNPALDVPSGADMKQGGMGDCYLIAALGSDCGQFALGHREHDHPQRRGERRGELDGPLLLLGPGTGLRGRLRDGQRDHAGLRGEHRLRAPRPGRQLVDPDRGKGLCRVERDGPGGPRRSEQLREPLWRLDGRRGCAGAGFGRDDLFSAGRSNVRGGSDCRDPERGGGDSGDLPHGRPRAVRAVGTG